MMSYQHPTLHDDDTGVPLVTTITPSTTTKMTTKMARVAGTMLLLAPVLMRGLHLMGKVSILRKITSMIPVFNTTTGGRTLERSITVGPSPTNVVVVGAPFGRMESIPKVMGRIWLMPTL